MIDWIVFVVSVFIIVFGGSFFCYYFSVLDFIREVKKHNRRCGVIQYIIIPKRFSDKVKLYRKFVVFKNDYILGAFSNYRMFFTKE